MPKSLFGRKKRKLPIIQFCQGFSAKGCGVDMPCILDMPKCADYYPKPGGLREFMMQMRIKIDALRRYVRPRSRPAQAA